MCKKEKRPENNNSIVLHGVGLRLSGYFVAKSASEHKNMNQKTSISSQTCLNNSDLKFICVL